MNQPEDPEGTVRRIIEGARSDGNQLRMWAEQPLIEAYAKLADDRLLELVRGYNLATADDYKQRVHTLTYGVRTEFSKRVSSDCRGLIYDSMRGGNFSDVVDRYIYESLQETYQRVVSERLIRQSNDLIKRDLQAAHDGEMEALKLEQERLELDAEGLEIARRREELTTQLVQQKQRDNRTARESFVNPILESKGWTTFEWATDSKVDFHTANDYLKGTTNPYRSTRKKLAESLGVPVQDLPK